MREPGRADASVGGDPSLASGAGAPADGIRGPAQGEPRPGGMVAAVASWSEIEAEAPDLASRARGFLTAHTHLTIATLRKDGSPRISGTEIQLGDGEIWFGSMWRAVKALDLLRDPRFAIHSGSEDPDAGWEGDAKFAGEAIEVHDAEVKRARGGPNSEYHLFRADITELVVVGLNEERTRMVIDSWHPGRGVERRER